MNGTEKAPVVAPTSPLPDHLARHLERHAQQIRLPSPKAAPRC